MKNLMLLLILLFWGGIFLSAQKLSQQELQQIEDELKIMMVEKVKEVNKQTPIQLDEITTFFNAVYQHPSLHYVYKLDVYKVDCDEDELEAVKQSLIKTQLSNREFLLKEYSKGKMSPRELALIFKQLGFKWVYTYFDINNEAILRFTIDFEDFE